jgi:hypothetical protein
MSPNHLTKGMFTTQLLHSNQGGKLTSGRVLSALFILVTAVNIGREEEHQGEQFVSDPISATYQYLLTQYGPLLTLKHVAEVLHGTPNGLRMAMNRKQQPFARSLAESRRRFGRRVFFEARQVARLIDDERGMVPGRGVILSGEAERHTPT